ncbi:MAG TPA: 3'-5' exonuclease, partial [Polyangiaceae bacterium LLY-WYZ-15_(1-7)]|nr:3'-5' exonuclease [Polyangiaceae bacterium LLY-WYZ-15_(1-7)]
EVDFDDMLRLVHEALEGPGGEALAATLRSQYRFALVDEFQDTDELQWAIFRRLFVESRAGHVLYVIGDPKQAIYGFRNADVHTYRQARERLMGGAAPVRLGRNFRSTARVIDAYNAVFAEGFFQGDIRYDEPVACGDPSRRAIGPGGEDAPAMTLWTVAGAEKPSAAELRATLGDRIAREVKALVEGEPAPLRIVEKGRTRRVGYADVFVLTRNAREAEAIAEALARHGVPHAFYKQDGLFDTQEARDVLDVLRAVADPSDRSARLRAWLTPFFAVPLSSLAACRDLDPQHPLVARLFRLRQLAERHDGAGLLRALVEESGLVRRLLFLDSTGRGRESASGDGERALTNIQHVIEVLLEESGGRRGVDELVARLEAFVEGRAEPMSGEGAVQRLESDRPAVQLLTMHKSKGLEAGVVFLAGGFTKGGSGDRHEPLIAHEDGQREAWLRPVPDEVEERVAREAREEDERLLYVALTRAKARLYVPYLGPPPPGAEGALAGLERYGPLRGPLRWLDERLAALVRGGFVDGDAVTWERVEVRPPEPRDVAADRAALEALEVREARGGARWDALREAHAGYVLTSYTRMKSREGGYVAPPLEGEGGAGEEFTGEVAEPAPGAALALEEELDALPGGAGMGVFLHGVLEDLDPAEVKAVADADAWAARPRVARLFEARARTSGVDAAHLPAAARLIHRALRAPQRFGGVHLEGGFCELEERVAEMSFHY